MPFEVKITGHQTKEALKGATCVLPISVGQDYHEGAIFAETLRQLKETFEHVIIVVADTLQENSLILKGTPKADAKNLALNNGTQWLARNKTAISSLPESFYTIMRWNVWLNDPAYSEQKELVDEKYISDAAFTDSVNGAAREYKKLHQKKVKAAEKKGLKPDVLCRETILQEAAVIGLWINKGYNYMAYPVERGAANQQIFDCLTKTYTADFKLLHIEIENKPDIVSTIVAAAEQSEFSEEQKATIRELGAMITQPFLTQLITVSKGHLLDNDALKIAFLLSIEAQIKLTCTELVHKMEIRQLADKGLASAHTTPPTKAKITSATVSGLINYATLFQPIDSVSPNHSNHSNPTSPTRELVKKGLPKRRHSDSNEHNIAPIPLTYQMLATLSPSSDSETDNLSSRRTPTDPVNQKPPGSW